MCNWLLTIFSRAGVSTRHSIKAPSSWRDSTKESTDFTENRPFASSVVAESIFVHKSFILLYKNYVY